MKKTFVAVLLVLALTGAAWAQEAPLSSGDYDLRDLTTRVSRATGRTILYGPDFTGSVHIDVADPDLSPDALWQLYLSALAEAGWGVVVHGRVVRVAPRDQLATEAGPVLAPGETAPANEGMVTATFELNNADPTDIAMRVSPLVGKEGQVIPVVTQGRLIVVASAANVEKIRKLLEKLDVPEQRRQIEVVRPKHADLADLAELISQLFGKYTIEGNQPRYRTAAGGLIVVPEPGRGALVLRGEQRDIDAAVRLIRAIDEAADPLIVIRTLRYADHAKLTATLSDLLKP